MDRSSTATKPARNRRLAVVSIGLSLLFALGLTEVFVRLLLPYNSPDQIAAHSVDYVPAVYARHLLEPVGRLVDVDDKKAWGEKPQDAPTDELLYISERGYRGPPFALRKPPGTTRIIVVGGSSVFDQNVRDTYEDNERTWPHRVGKQLRSEGLAGVEVINAGVPGHASADSLGRLFSQLWIYEPDMIVVYLGWNDIKFWHQAAITPERPLTTHVQPYDPGSNPFTTYRGGLDRFLSHSQIYMKLRNRYFVWQTNVGAEGARSSNGAQPLADEYSEFGPAQFRLNMELIVAASRSIGATPVLIQQATLIAPDNSQADIGKIAFDYQSLTHAALVRAYEDAYRVVREVGEATATDVIDAAAQMNGRSEYFSDHVHTSPAGSTRLAEIVAGELATILHRRDDN